MGISIHVAEMIVREHLYRPIGGKVVLLGHQTMFFSPEDAVNLITKCGGTPAFSDLTGIAIDNTTLNSGHGEKGFIKDVEFFRLLGANEVIALDHSDYEGAELIWNLNLPIPERLEGIADFILDGSTIDNVFDPACTLRNMNRLLKPNGRIISTNMGSNHYAPYTIPTPQWIFDYFVYNRFSDVRPYYLVYTSSGLNVFTLDLELQVKTTLATETLHSPYVVGIVFVAEKGVDSTWKENPSQHHYRPDAEWEAFSSNLKPIRSSQRPLHLISEAPRDASVPQFVGFSFAPPVAPVAAGSIVSNMIGQVRALDEPTQSVHVEDDLKGHFLKLQQEHIQLQRQCMSLQKENADLSNLIQSPDVLVNVRAHVLQSELFRRYKRKLFSRSPR